MDFFDRVKETGEWWVEPWWEQPDRQVHFPCPKEVLQQATEVLKQYFDAAWTKDLANNPRENLVFPELCLGGSTRALSFIANLGEMLGKLIIAKGVKLKIDDLKGEKGESCYLELESAYAFASAGYEIEFPAEGASKSPDVIVKLGNVSLAIECKRLRSEIWESWEEELTHQLIPALPWMKNERQISVQVSLNPRLTEVRISEDRESSLNAAFRDAIVSEIVDAVSGALAINEIPFAIRVHELASVRVAYRDAGEYASVSGMERGSPALFRRVFQNGFLRACEQVPNGAPALLVIYSKFAPAPALFTTLFSAACAAQPERFSKITAVMICSLQTMFRSSTPLIYINKNTAFDSEIEPVVKALSSGFGAVVAG